MVPKSGKEGTRARGGGSKGFGSGGVGGRGTGPRDGANFATCVVFLTFLTRTKRRKMAFFLKDRFRGGRWYGHGLQGRGLGCRRGLGGRRGWMAVPKKGRVEAWLAVQKSGGEAPRPEAPRP